MKASAPRNSAVLDHAPGTGAPSLFDVLPLRTGATEPDVHRLQFALPAAQATAVAAALQRHALTAGELLCAALAWVESRLTGADAVLATLDRRQATVGIARDSLAPDWCRQVAQDLQVAARPAPWMATEASEISLDTAGPASAWRLLPADARLEVDVRAPWGDETAGLIAGCVLRVVTGLLDDQSVLATVDPLDPDERARQLVEWNRVAIERDPTQTVHARFRAICSTCPDAPAVIDATITLSYAELDCRAEALAARLRGAGIAGGEVVAVAAEHSAAAIVALLAVLKAGAAYLPLDIQQPAQRLAYLLEDSAARVMLVESCDDLSVLPEAIERVPIDLARVDPAAVASGDGVNAGDCDDLAYVMYTSGSTGTPKGVEIRHRSILRLVCDVDYVTLGPATRMLHAAPLGFDASTLEVWGALLNGGCVVVHDEAKPTGPGLAATIVRHGVTTAWLTAALFNAVVDEDPRQLSGLRELFSGGEALSVDHVRRMRRAAPATRLRNGYGPTECTTFTCTYAIDDEILDDATSIPIGRPIADTQVYVLNAHREPVPVGVLGELHVGGAGLARGYLRQPELTAERFIPNPFCTDEGQRLYRTGDLVRYRNDGVIEFSGRCDTQVKIRGFRIELGEIEAALATHPAVQSCVLLARDDHPGDKRLVAYYVATGAEPPPAQLRAHLAMQLPEFMLPARYLRLDAWPVTTNGKLDRRALPAPDNHRPDLAAAFEPPAGAEEQRLCDVFSQLLDIHPVGRHDNFFELGGNSLLAMRLLERLRVSGPDLQPSMPDGIGTVTVFQHPTPMALAAVLAGRHQRADPARLARVGRDADAGPSAIDDPIAIVAMAGRFPGADDVEAFWRNLCEGRDSITLFHPDELDPSVSTAERNDPAYVCARGVIDGVEQFDAAFFGISPKEAELMDPQQRIFLELCWQCLERGGHVPDATTAPVGVFAGMYNATYYQRHLASRSDLIDKVGAFQVMLGNEKDYITTRVAHKLNLTGPTVSVHTACSTSLVAICQAMDSLRAGRCDMALAGGVSVTCPPRSGYLYQEGAMLSPDGRTRSFDAGAQGTVFSDGAAVVLLKRWSDAITDGNPVYAVIRGGAVNNDGGHKASFTAPSSDGQAAVIAMAHADARVRARSISYVETHGTATPLGDPIEIQGLTQAFRRDTDDVGFCRIGSVKSNVGHTVIAAGATGVIKTALALAERRIPGNAHFESPNSAIDFDRSPFVVNAGLSDWPSDGAPRRAGVSSFGVGGTNAHVVMEEAPARPASPPSAGAQLLVLSARTPAALGQAAENLAAHLAATPDINLADVTWTLAVGRKAFAHRIAITAEDALAATATLRSVDTVAAIARSRPARLAEVVFLFPGQGATYPGMGRGLYETEPAFRAAFDECMDVLGDLQELRQPGMDQSVFGLRARMFGDDPQALLPTAVMQPATFALEYALARWWMSCGITPIAMIGHSVGEFVAATLAGVFNLRDAMRLVARRGALMQAQPAGGMLSVRLGRDALLARLPASLSLAAENAPGACVVAGPLEAIAQFQNELETEGVACRALRTSHAFHSAMMEPVVAPFLAEVAAVARRAPMLPLVSTATGDWLDADTAMSAEYWARHLREPVRFATALGRVVDAQSRVLLEVGPRASLSALARQHPDVAKQRIAVVSSLVDSPDAESSSLRLAAGQLWCHGVAVDPSLFDRRVARRRLRLPTYPFERQRHWVDAPVAASNIVAHPAAVAATESVMPHLVASPMVAGVPTMPLATAVSDRKPALVARLRELFEDVAGYDVADADPQANFIELGLDSLTLTQVALQLQKTFATKVSFRQLMGECASLDRLAQWLDAQMPAAPAAAIASTALASALVAPLAAASMPGLAGASATGVDGDFVRAVIAQQMQLMAQQLALLSGHAVSPAAPGLPLPLPATAVSMAATSAPVAGAADAAAATDTEDEAAIAHTRYDVKKAFGAIARIDTNARFELNERQRTRLDAFIARYVARTRKSKDYTQRHRAHMADPRVVNGFRPLLKEIIYQIVIERSKGAQMWDLDGNVYVDALNGFGMSLFGWQPDFVLDAVRRQLDLGYEIGPQHPLAGEVAQLICEVTGHDRAALCNTGSEAVLGALRIARTVTGRETVVLFTGSYHGIIDEMIVRGTRKLRAVPAAPGILRNTAEHVLVLDYGTPEAMQIIRERAHEIAAVLVEPIQSRRPDFQPREFLQELRQLTSDAGALLVFDEVVTGFRAHPGGAQALFDVQADLATYGKVVGGGYPIGVIAGKRDFMDALDGGHWQFGDDSVPSVGVTYFAGTFVRHPLALAAAKAVLTHIRDAGPQLQRDLNARTAAMAAELTAFCADHGAPIEVRHFASVWKTFFLEDHPLQDLLFAIMRSQGVHILDNFPCFMTTAHSAADIQSIVDAFKAAVIELQEAEFLPRRAATPRTVMDAAHPVVPGAQLGREPDGRPAWFVPNPEQSGKYLKVGG